MMPNLPFLPATIGTLLDKLPGSVQAAIEEIRVREARPLEIVAGGESRFVGRDGRLTAEPSEAYAPSKDDALKLLDLLTNHSLYTFEEELRRGFITTVGGHRVGLAGKAVLERGQIRHLRDIAGFNIRIAREVLGVGRSLLSALWDEEASSVHQTLIVSPPRHGKTTLVRDLARLLSTGVGLSTWRPQVGLKVAIVDERSEIAACVKGVPSFDVGPRTDVLDGCPKAEGMMMMIRSMSPDVLIVDEIGRPEDAVALQEALHAGVRVIATAHGRTIEELKGRPVMRRLLEERMFGRVVELTRSRERGMRLAVRDGFGRLIGDPERTGAGAGASAGASAGLGEGGRSSC